MRASTRRVEDLLLASAWVQRLSSVELDAPGQCRFPSVDVWRGLVPVPNLRLDLLLCRSLEVLQRVLVVRRINGLGHEFDVLLQHLPTRLVVPEHQQ